MRWASPSVSVLVTAMSLACMSGEPQPEPQPEPPPKPPPTTPTPIKGNLERISVPQGAEQRIAWLHVPDRTAKGWDKPMPLLVVFHDQGSNGKQMAEWFTRWFDRGVLIAFPYAGAPEDKDASWKGGKDIEFARAVVDQIQRRYKVAEGKVFATGFANGASMTWQVACHASDVFQGAAPVASSMPRKLSENCPTDGADHPLLVVAGTADPVSLWSGRDDLLPVTDSVGIWLTKNDCDAATEKVSPIADVASDDRSTVKRHDWTCKGAPVSLLEIVGGEHSWPRQVGRGQDTNRDIDTTDEIMRFFGIGQ